MPESQQHSMPVVSPTPPLSAAETSAAFDFAVALCRLAHSSRYLLRVIWQLPLLQFPKTARRMVFPAPLPCAPSRLRAIWAALVSSYFACLQARNSIISQARKARQMDKVKVTSQGSASLRCCNDSFRLFAACYWLRLCHIATEVSLLISAECHVSVFKNPCLNGLLKKTVAIRFDSTIFAKTHGRASFAQGSSKFRASKVDR